MVGKNMVVNCKCVGCGVNKKTPMKLIEQIDYTNMTDPKRSYTKKTYHCLKCGRFKTTKTKLEK